MTCHEVREGGGGGIAIPFLQPQGRWLTPRSGRFTPGMTRYPLYRRLGGAQGRSGRIWKISPQPGFDPRTVQPVASRNFQCTPKILFFFLYPFSWFRGVGYTWCLLGVYFMLIIQRKHTK
jgi:hypothetical protein